MSSPSTTSICGKLTPNLDHSSTKMLNLTVLQRVDPFIEEILITAAHVTIYGFNVEQNKWSRRDVEGSLFVVKRSTQPRFQFIVMNRRNTENLVEDLLGGFEFEVQVPYLLYRKASQEVNGVWFYNAHECGEVADLFSRILGAYARVAPESQVTPSNSEFEGLQAMATSRRVIEGPLEPSVTPTVATVHRDDSLTNFFSQMAMSTGPSFSHDLNSGQLYPNNLPVSPLPQVYSASSYLPTQPLPSYPVSSLSVPSPTLYLGSNLSNNSTSTANLLMPSSLLTPPSSSSVFTVPMTSSGTTPVHPLVNLQRDHGNPVIQPFPPPTPALSLTANPAYGLLRKERVQEALVTLVQDDRFIDMVYQALSKVHHQS